MCKTLKGSGNCPNLGLQMQTVRAKATRQRKGVSGELSPRTPARIAASSPVQHIVKCKEKYVIQIPCTCVPHSLLV